MLRAAALKRAQDQKASDAKAQSLSADELLACDVAEYLKQGDHYVKPGKYSQRFSKPLSQTQALHISRYAHPVQDQKAERRLLFKTMSLYAIKNELPAFVQHLNSFAEKATANFAISLGSDNHRVSLGYDVATKSWELMDVNQPDSKPIPITHSAQLVSWIKKAFLDENADFSCFCAKVYCRADQYTQLKPLATQLEAEESFKKLHEVTPDRAKRVNLRGMTLAWLLTRHGNLRGLASLSDQGVK